MKSSNKNGFYHAVCILAKPRTNKEIMLATVARIKAERLAKEAAHV